MGPSEDRIIIPPQGGTQCPDRWDNEPLASPQRSFSCPEPKLEAPGYTTGLQSPSTHTQCPPGSLIAPFGANFAYVLASLSPFPRGDPGPHIPPWGRRGTHTSAFHSPGYSWACRALTQGSVFSVISGLWTEPCRGVQMPMDIIKAPLDNCDLFRQDKENIQYSLSPKGRVTKTPACVGIPGCRVL